MFSERVDEMKGYEVELTVTAYTRAGSADEAEEKVMERLFDDVVDIQVESIAILGTRKVTMDDDLC